MHFLSAGFQALLKCLSSLKQMAMGYEVKVYNT